jgi:hypothetical protein
MALSYMNCEGGKSQCQSVFLNVGEMYYEEIRRARHYTLNKEIFLLKPISTDHLIREKTTG